MKDDCEEAVQVVNKIHRMLVGAIAAGTKLTWTYDFIKPATARDLAKIETAINGLLRGVMRRDFKLKPKQIPKFFLNLNESAFVDDGDNSVTVTLDFGKLLPGERPPELLAMVKDMHRKWGDNDRDAEAKAD